MKIKVYRLLASRLIVFPDGTDRWDIPEQTTIIPSAITAIRYVDRRDAVIQYEGFTYKIDREDFDKIFEVEVL